MLNYIKIVAVVLLVSLFGIFHLHQIKKAEDKVKQRYEQAIKDAEIKAQETTILIAAQSKALEKDKDEKIKTLNYRINTLVSELQQRPSRSTNYSTTPTIVTSCTGAQLYREDGEFLAGEAARAQRVLIERDYYYNEYENARAKLNEFTSTQTRPR